MTALLGEGDGWFACEPLAYVLAEALDKGAFGSGRGVEQDRGSVVALRIEEDVDAVGSGSSVVPVVSRLGFIEPAEGDLIVGSNPGVELMRVEQGGGECDAGRPGKRFEAFRMQVGLKPSEQIGCCGMQAVGASASISQAWAG